MDDHRLDHVRAQTHASTQTHGPHVLSRTHTPAVIKSDWILQARRWWKTSYSHQNETGAVIKSHGVAVVAHQFSILNLSSFICVIFHSVCATIHVHISHYRRRKIVYPFIRSELNAHKWHFAHTVIYILLPLELMWTPSYTQTNLTTEEKPSCWVCDTLWLHVSGNAW